MELSTLRHLIAPHLEAIKADETGAIAEQVAEELLESLDDEAADALYDHWDELIS